MAPRIARIALCLLLALALAPAADAKLKKKKQTLKMGELSKQLEKYEGTDLAPKEVTYTTFGDDDFDAFSRKAAEVKLLGRFTNNVIRDSNKKLDHVKSEKDLKLVEDNLDMAKKCAEYLQKAGPDLARSGETLYKKLPDKVLSDPQGYAENLDAMQKIVTDGVNVGTKTPGLAAEMVGKLAKAGSRLAKEKAKFK